MLALSKSKTQPLFVHDTLQEKGVALFTPREFMRIFGTSPRKTRYFLEAYTQHGLLVRLKNDLYALREKIPNEEAIANRLYQPSYVSLEYALSRYGIIPESPYTITSVTTKATVAFTVLGKEFSFRKIKREAYTGYVPERAGSHTILIADPEKALADYLYFVSLGKKTINDRTDCRRLDKKKTLGYAALFGRKSMYGLIEEVWDLKPVIM